jgi:hypothetical protein
VPQLSGRLEVVDNLFGAVGAPARSLNLAAGPGAVGPLLALDVALGGHLFVQVLLRPAQPLHQVRRLRTASSGSTSNTPLKLFILERAASNLSFATSSWVHVLSPWFRGFFAYDTFHISYSSPCADS